MSIVAKRSPISATVELCLDLATLLDETRSRNSTECFASIQQGEKSSKAWERAVVCNEEDLAGQAGFTEVEDHNAAKY